MQPSTKWQHLHEAANAASRKASEARQAGYAATTVRAWQLDARDMRLAARAIARQEAAKGRS